MQLFGVTVRIHSQSLVFPESKVYTAIRWLWARALVIGVVFLAAALVSCLGPDIESYTFKIRVLNRTASTYYCVSCAFQLNRGPFQARSYANTVSAGGIVFGPRDGVTKLSAGAMVIQPIGPPSSHLMQLQAGKRTDFRNVAVVVIIWRMPEKDASIEKVLSTEPAFQKVFYHPEFTFQRQVYTYLPFAEIEIGQSGIRVIEQQEEGQGGSEIPR